MKTITQIINSARLGSILTDGKQKWKVIGTGGEGKIAVPVKYTSNTFEMWAEGGMEKCVSLPGLRVIKVK